MSLIDKLKDLVQKKRSDSVSVVSEPLDDWDTRDKSLKALRRLKRTQLDELERKALLKSIANHNIRRDKAYFNDSSILNGDKSRLNSRVAPKVRIGVDECGFIKPKIKGKFRGGLL